MKIRCINKRKGIINTYYGFQAIEENDISHDGEIFISEKALELLQLKPEIGKGYRLYIEDYDLPTPNFAN
jgi:hypothetical protein